MLVCIFLESKEHFGIKFILICRFLIFIFFVFVSPVFHKLSAERRRHDVHVLFGDVSYDVRNTHWRVNNKIKRKFTLFQ